MSVISTRSAGVGAGTTLSCQAAGLGGTLQGTTLMPTWCPQIVLPPEQHLPLTIFITISCYALQPVLIIPFSYIKLRFKPQLNNHREHLPPTSRQPLPRTIIKQTSFIIYKTQYQYQYLTKLNMFGAVWVVVCGSGLLWLHGALLHRPLDGPLRPWCRR